MPKTDKICMYFDKEELQEIIHKLEKHLTIDDDIKREIIYRTIEKIKSRLSEK